MNKRTKTIVRVLIWTLCLCFTLGLRGAEAAQSSHVETPSSPDGAGADALGKTKRPRTDKAPRRNPTKRRAPKKKAPKKKAPKKKAPKKKAPKKKAPKTDDVGALAYDFGYTMGILSGASYSKSQAANANSWVSSAQQARNLLAKKVSFAGFKSVREDIGFKGYLHNPKVVAARTRYQANIKKRGGMRIELAYVFGLQMGITEVIASNCAGMETGFMKKFTRAVLNSLTESDLAELGLDIALMQNADQQAGSWPGHGISAKQARNIHAAVVKARIAYRHTILKAPASFWAKK